METDIPRFPMADIERRRSRILSVLNERIGHALSADALVACLLTSSALKGVKYDVLFESVRGREVLPLSSGEIKELAWRLAGNLDTLRKGEPVTAWHDQPLDAWVPLQIRKMQKFRRKDGKAGYWVEAIALAGPPVLQVVSTFWSSAVVGIISRKVGFSRYQGTYQLHDATDLVNTRMLGYIESHRSRDQLSFYQVECPAAMVAWNRKNVLKLRCRVGADCPMRFRHHCFQCAMGYDRCVGATHSHTYEVKSCPHCGNGKAPFDPSTSSNVCVECAAALRMQPKKG